MTILALYSNKGGVGKTAAAVNLSYLAAKSGVHTLICDLDPQSSATFYFRVNPKLKRKARGLSTSSAAVEKSVKGTDYENLDLLPADFTHRNLDITYDRLKHSKYRLSRVLDPFKKEYDLIIIDCLPTINILAENIFNTADIILVPIIPTTLSIRTHMQLLTFFNDTNRNPNAINTFFSMVDRRKKMHLELMTSVQQEIDGVLSTIIPYLSIIEKMGIQRQPVPAYAPNSEAARAYQDLWSEVRNIARAKKR